MQFMVRHDMDFVSHLCVQLKLELEHVSLCLCVVRLKRALYTFLGEIIVLNKLWIFYMVHFFSDAII